MYHVAVLEQMFRYKLPSSKTISRSAEQIKYTKCIYSVRVHDLPEFGHFIFDNIVNMLNLFTENSSKI